MLLSSYLCWHVPKVNYSRRKFLIQHNACFGEETQHGLHKNAKLTSSPTFSEPLPVEKFLLHRRCHQLYRQVENEYERELADRIAGDRDAMDPYVFDLYNAVRYVEEFGGERWYDKQSHQQRDMIAFNMLLEARV